MTETPGLTLDNYPLSRPIPVCAIKCTERASETLAELVRDSLAENTRRAYSSDLTHFQNWGGILPASDIMIASYIAALSETLSTSTIVRRLTSISKAHEAAGIANAVRSLLVRATLRGIKRRHGTSQHQAKPLTKEDLFIVLGALGDTMKDVRDRVLLLLGFAGAFRRSELVAIDKEDITAARQGIIVRLNRSKTDQIGLGRERWLFPTADHDGVRSLLSIYGSLGPASAGAPRSGPLIGQDTLAPNGSRERLSLSLSKHVYRQRASTLGSIQVTVCVQASRQVPLRPGCHPGTSDGKLGMHRTPCWQNI
jgi:integrase